MGNTCTIRVFYPKQGGRIVLHTELDWDQDVEPSRIEDDGTRWEFDLTTDRPYLYFKPCIRDGSGALHWSVGSNYLAVTTTSQVRDLYPHFFDGQNGDITHPLEVPGGDGHRVRVYQPPGYDENTLKRYPVLYMHDGTNLFFPEEAFLGETWRIEQTMDMLDDMNVIDKVIVVGVYATDRMNEYTAPGYEGYGRFLVEALKPFVDGGFRTLGGPADTAVMGSSLGGVVSFYLAFQYPEVFGQAACLSSTFGYRDDLFQRVRSEPKRAVRLYLDSGWPGDNYENTQSMRDLLAQRGWRPGDDLCYYAYPGATHDEGSWATRCHIPFQFFFDKTPRFT
jgi:predicted alpha/beta superfamily hydrolase